jgi:hypothetical protein
VPFSQNLPLWAFGVQNKRFSSAKDSENRLIRLLTGLHALFTHSHPHFSQALLLLPIIYAINHEKSNKILRIFEAFSALCLFCGKTFC